MIDFIGQQTSVVNYVKTNLPALLTELNLTDFNDYIMDYVDLDIYKKPKQMFFDFNSYNYSELSNESEVMEVTFSIYLTFMNDKPTELNKKMMIYTAALHELFDRSGNNFGGIFDYGLIESDQFYQAAEGDKSKKVSQINFKMMLEN